MSRFEVTSTRREQLIDVTRHVEAAVATTGVQNGLCHVFSPHTTCGVTVNENSDPDVPADMLKWFREAIPQDGGFRHGEGNADAHIKTSLVGCFQLVPVKDGRLDLGRWQAVFLCEFDGPRTRTLQVTAFESR
jgi:secondary thiamine-phosphate synthase enzyme